MRQSSIWLLTCVTILACSSVAHSQEAQRFAAAKDQATRDRYFRRAVIRIEDRTKSGSGFLVREDDLGRKYAITNAHVVEAMTEMRIDVYPHGSIDVRDEIEVLAKDAARDLALIRFRTDASVAFLRVAPRNSRKLRDDAVCIVGFPGSTFTQENTRITDERVWKGGYQKNWFYLDSRFGAGGSGSPVIGYDTNDQLQIVGVYRGYTDTKGVACFEIEEFLIAARYRTLMDGKSSTRQKQTEIGLLLGLFFEEVMED